MDSRIKKITRGDNICFIVAVIFIVLIALCGLWAYDISKTDIDKPKHLFDIDNVDEYVYINNNDYIWKFATDDAYKYVFIPYYFEHEGETYREVAIAAFEFEQYDKLEKIYEELDENDEFFDEGISYTGMSKIIPEDLKKLAYDAYKEEFPETKVTLDNFEDYFGNYYIVVDASPYDYSGPIVMAIVLLIIGSYFIYRGFKAKKVTKDTLNSDEYIKALEELENPEWETKRAVLTKNYIIYADCGLKIVDYKDITWVYRHTYTYNGVPNHSLAYYVRGSKKMHLISYGFKESTVNEMVNYIGNKNSNILVGYTNENKKLFKEIV